MDDDAPTARAAAIPVTEEQLEVHRNVVDTGAVRVRKHVDEAPVSVREPVATDLVEVQRVAIGHVVAEAPAVRQEGDGIVVPVIEERLVTRKELVLVEEIRLVRRRQVTHAEAQVPLRRERVSVERFDPGTDTWLPEPGS